MASGRLHIGPGEAEGHGGWIVDAFVGQRQQAVELVLRTVGERLPPPAHHFWPGNDRECSKADAQAEYPGEVQVAGEGPSIDLS